MVDWVWTNLMQNKTIQDYNAYHMGIWFLNWMRGPILLFGLVAFFVYNR